MGYSSTLFKKSNVALAPGLSPQGEATSFEGCLLRANPTQESLEQLSDQQDETPILMLNFLRFRPRGDSTIYSLYAEQAKPEVAKVRSFIGYYGQVLVDLPTELGFDEHWDGIVIPVYHRRDSYLSMQQSPQYQLALPYRSAGTSRRLLYPLIDNQNLYKASHSIKEFDNSRKGIEVNPGEIYVAELLQFTDDGRCLYQMETEEVSEFLSNVGASVELSVDTELPVLSEQQWDHFVLTRFPSKQAMIDLYNDDNWKSSQQQRQKGLKNSLYIATIAIALPD